MGIIATVDEDFQSAGPSVDELTLTLDGWEGPLDLLLSLVACRRSTSPKSPSCTGRQYPPIWPKRGREA
jgi:hypothetical protein